MTNSPKVTRALCFTRQKFDKFVDFIQRGEWSHTSNNSCKKCLNWKYGIYLKVQSPKNIDIEKEL